MTPMKSLEQPPDDDLQLDLYAQPPAGWDEGAKRADANAEKEWRHHAMVVIREFAASGAEWTADDLRERVGDPDHPNRLGAVILAARKAGLIVPTGQVRPSTVASRHGNLNRVWVGAGKSAA